VKRLFVELYLDEDVDVLVARLLRAHGFVAVTCRDAGQLNRSDESQFDYAIEEPHEYSNIFNAKWLMNKGMTFCCKTICPTCPISRFHPACLT